MSFSMPHYIYNHSHNADYQFFDSVNMFSKLDQIEMRVRIGKFLAFDKSLVKRLLSSKEYQDVAEIEDVRLAGVM